VRPTRKAVAILVVGGMEACWLLVALALVQARSGTAVPWLLGAGPGALLAGAAWTVTARQGTKVRTAARLLGGIAWAAAAWAAATPNGARILAAPGVMAGSVALAAWAWGCRLAAARFGYDQVLREFQLGLVALLVTGLCAAQWGIALPGMPPAAFAFFLLFASGAAAALADGPGRWLNAGSRRVWLALAAANGAAVLGCGAFTAAAVTPEVLDGALTVLGIAWNAALGLLRDGMLFLAGLFPTPHTMDTRPMGPRTGMPQQPTLYHEVLRLPEWLRWSAEAATVTVWAVLGGVAVWRTVSQVATWLRRQVADMEGAEIENVRGAFRRDLLRLLWRVRSRLKAAAEWVRARLGMQREDAPSAEAAAVRRCYRRLLAWSAAAGCNRIAAQTPYEFLARLSAWRPHARTSFSLITEHYVRVRYGGVRPGPAALQEVEQAWREVKRARR
jgi:hypothetical protein